MMLCGGLAIAVVSLLVSSACRDKKLHKSRLFIVSIALAIIQIVLIHSYYFYTDWDVQQLTGAAEAIAKGETTDEFSWYFQNNPNNVFLTRIFALVFFLTGSLWGNDISLFPLLCIQCLQCWIASLMLYQTAMHIWHSKSSANIVYLLYSIIIGASPWWSIPYSDVWGLTMVVIILWVATTCPFRKGSIRVLFVAMLSTIGYYIKPQIVLVGFAILIVCAAEFWRKQTNPHKAKILTVWMVSGIVIAIGLVHATAIGNNLYLNSSKALGVTHYLMLGANEKTTGVYDDDDVAFSCSFDKKGERRNAQIKETVRRYKEMGVGGTLTLWSRKNMLNFSDGTFGWGHEGRFFKTIPEHNGQLAQLTKQIYYYNSSFKGRYYTCWAIAATSIWFGLLIFSLVGAIGNIVKSKKSNAILNIIALSFFFLTIFHTLFECRSRYMFSFAPLVILLAADGCNMLSLQSPCPSRGGGYNRATGADRAIA